MAASGSHCSSAIRELLLLLSVFVVATSAQITFNRHWRRGNYPGEVEGMENGEIAFSHGTNSNQPPVAIARFPDHPTSVILSGNVLGKIWKGAKNFPSASTQNQPPTQHVSVHW